MMKINVAQIRKTVGACQSYCFLCSGESLIQEDHCWLNREIEVRGQIINTGQGLLIEGVIRGISGQSCHRCLKEFERLMEIPFAENYREADSAVTIDSSDAVLFYGDEIDVADLIVESLLLAEPIKTLCSESCLGLCPKCGADLNDFPCACEKGTIDPRLASLQKLLKQ